MRGSEQKKKTRQIVAAKIMCTPVEIFMTPSARAAARKKVNIPPPQAFAWWKICAKIVLG